MELLKKIIVCFIAGAGAGIGTGFAGMSAAAVIGPMLYVFLDIDSYAAISIGLASDVLASAVSALIYRKNKNIDIKNGFVLLVTVLCFTVVGSFASSYIPNHTMGGFSMVMPIILGLKFIIKPVLTTKENMLSMPKKEKIIKSILGGSAIGFVCGFVGAGGGMMMLLVLTSLLGYELKTAVGTSVFVMAFTALTGSVSRFAIDGFPDWQVLVMCVCFTFLWARIAAVIANRSKPKKLSRVTGIILIVLGISVLSFNYLIKKA